MFVTNGGRSAECYLRNACRSRSRRACIQEEDDIHDGVIAGGELDTEANHPGYMLGIINSFLVEAHSENVA